MSLWGAVAGVATLVGPILGGVLVDGLGWEWIFFVNVPVGVVGLVLAARLVPELPTHVRRFDLVGVVLSAVGMFLLVFGIQEGQTYDWGTIAGPISVWSLIIAGVVVLAVFVGWQARMKEEPLLSLALFRDRNFGLACVAIAAVGFGVTAMAFPTMLYAQGVLGLSPAQSALLFVPMAIISGGLSPYVGRLTDRAHPRWVAGFGLACFVGGLVCGHGPGHTVLGAARADRAHRRGERVHVGADLDVGHPQPADEPGGRRRGRLQHHPADRGRAGQCGHRGAHAGPDHRRAPRCRGGRRVDGRAAPCPPRGIQRGDGPGGVAARCGAGGGPRRRVVLRHPAAPGGQEARRRGRPQLITP
jgi:Major Facilitator Superfamily